MIFLGNVETQLKNEPISFKTKMNKIKPSRLEWKLMWEFSSWSQQRDYLFFYFFQSILKQVDAQVEEYSYLVLLHYDYVNEGYYHIMNTYC